MSQDWQGSKGGAGREAAGRIDELENDKINPTMLKVKCWPYENIQQPDFEQTKICKEKFQINLTSGRTENPDADCLFDWLFGARL